MKSDPGALRSIRERNGHTARSLARASGVSHPRISQLEAVATPIRPTTAKRLADALKVDITEITTSESDPEPAEVAS